MVDQIEKIVTTLPDLTSVTDVCALADSRVAEGDAAFAADLGIALGRTYGASEQMWQHRGVLHHLLQLLATSAGPDNVVQALRLVSCAEVTSRNRTRSMASMLASSQEVAHLAAAFTGHASEELRTCLLHELVLRGVAVEETPEIERWAASHDWSRHPLGRLPLTRSVLEAGSELPSYSTYGASHSTPYGTSASSELAAVPGTYVPSSQETTTPATAAAMAGAVANWADESNGRIEARVFELADPLDPAAIADVLLALDLECLREPGPGAALSVDAVPPARVWEVLFAAASTGGAYNFGAGGAYGRLAAWQSLAALAGSAEGDTVGEVEARAQECTWYRLETGSAWFEQVAWDIGLAALGPGNRRLAVLAATDTD